MPVSDADIEISKEVVLEPTDNGCSAEFTELANFILQEFEFQVPQDVQEAKQLYLQMCTLFRGL